MKTTILAAPLATLGLALLSLLSQPTGVWELSADGDSVPIFVELQEHRAARVWSPGLAAPQEISKLRRNGPFLTLELPTGLSAAPGRDLALTLGPRGTLLRARVSGERPVLRVERSRHDDLGEVLTQASRLRAEQSAADHLPELQHGTDVERRAAALALGGAGLEVVPFVLNAVAKSDGSWNSWAVAALEAVGPEAVDPLQKALYYENEQVARVAADALGRLSCGGCAAHETLLQAARSHSDAHVRRLARDAVRQEPAA